MKMKALTASILIGIMASSSFVALANPISDPANQAAKVASVDLTQQQLIEKAKDAYMFTFPLVMNYRTMYLQAIEGNNQFGQWKHLGLTTPQDEDIVTPNLDTPYSYAWVDVRSQPWVLTIPKMEEDRFFTSQWDDMWGFVLDNVGSVNDGNDGQTVMLVSPNWKGEKPKGVDRIIRGESDFLGSLTRTQVVGSDEDMPNVRTIQQQIKLQPLNEYLGTPAPQAAPALDFPKWVEGAEATDAFWDYAAFVLKHIKVNEIDQAMYENLAQIGLVPGKDWQKDQLSDAQLAAIHQGLVQQRAFLEQRSTEPVDTNILFQGRDGLKDNYLDRMLGVYMGIFGNKSTQSVYFPIAKDDQGQLLDGSKHSYELTFTKAALPPVKYFWSYTMYKLPSRWLVANSENRYSFNNRTPDLITNEDGSVTFYLSAKKPDNDDVNWLPAPEAPFWTVIRTYGPQAPILNGQWQAPQAKVVK